MRLHTIIYNVTDEIKRAMTGLLEPVFREVYRGKAEVRDTFRITKVGNVAGCQVLDGTITRDSEVRLLRDNVVVHTGKIGSLRRFKDDVSEVKSGMECGITLQNYADVKQGDIIEAFVTERVAHEVFASSPWQKDHAVDRRPDFGTAARRVAFTEGEAPRGAEPEGSSPEQVQRFGGGD